jgi:hypothetical protein
MIPVKLILLRPSLEQQVRNLFRMGEQGAWCDPSDFSTMYQDSTGMTPVTAAAQPVGLFLDKRSTRGLELVSNGGFTTDTAWEKEASWTISGGAATWDAAGATNKIYQLLPLVAGKSYEALFDITAFTGSPVIVVSPDGSTGPTVATSLGRARAVISSASANQLMFYVYGSGTLTIDNVSLCEITGNHGVQATADARPTLAAGGKIDYDEVDDALVTTWASALGANCTVGRAVAGTGASILTGQTIGTTYTDNTDHHGLVIIDRALSPQETLSLTRYLNRKSGL